MKLNHISRPVIFTLAVLMLSCFGMKAQGPTYMQLLSIISSKAPNLNVSDKVIIFSSWSATHPQSRAANKELDRVGKIYSGAKLKNGSKGDVFISMSVDDDATATIAFNRDEIRFAIKVNKSDFPFLSTVPADYNVVYDNTSAKVYENLTKEQVFSSLNQLITR